MISVQIVPSRTIASANYFHYFIIFNGNNIESSWIFYRKYIISQQKTYHSLPQKLTSKF